MNPQKPVPAPKPAEGRKPWVKKRPIDIFLDQIAKQEQRVTEMRQALTHEERELAKLQQARKVLEAQ
jgi:hypothetical protein